MQTQWRYAPNGMPTGLDYAGVRAYLDESALDAEPRRDAWRGIVAAEGATLEVLAEKQKHSK